MTPTDATTTSKESQHEKKLRSTVAAQDHLDLGIPRANVNVEMTA